ncbi:MAG: hypothetical protein L0K86_27535, partial [Actinomycetia bacterium]|nr:hypothetical protein [Actinomycetes bacterium]
MSAAAGPSPATVATAHLELAEALVDEAARRGITVADAALSWPLQLADTAGEAHRLEFLQAVLLDTGGDAAGAWAGIARSLASSGAQDWSHLALAAAWANSRTPPAAGLDAARALAAACKG